MAVRDDFAPGEVLAAADLNDTFASKLPYSYGTATPSTTDSGFLWYDSNTTPPTTKYWNGSAFAPVGAMVLITDEAVAGGTSSVSFNNVFTNGFRNYMVTFDVLGSTTLSVRYRMRASGTDDSGSNYDIQVLNVAGTTVAASRNEDQTSGVAAGTSANWSSNVLWIFEPTFARFTRTAAQMYYFNPIQWDTAVGTHNLNTAYDGITFFTSTGTMQGQIKIYGLQ